MRVRLSPVPQMILITNLILTTMNYANEYITPTKESPVFSAECNYFGYIEEARYKDYCIHTDKDNCDHLGRTWALDFTSAIVRLHEWIRYNADVLTEYPKCKFTIFLLDGSVDKYGDPVHYPVYSITAKNCKRFLL